MKTTSKTNLFLMELIVMVLVFSLSSASCVYIFSNAQVVSESSRNLSSGAMKAQSVAACFKKAQGDLEKCAQYVNGRADGDKLTVLYSESWQTVENNQDAAFELGVTMSKDENRLGNIDVKKISTGESIFDMQVKAVDHE